VEQIKEKPIVYLQPSFFISKKGKVLVAMSVVLIVL
jgi:hypothetical protein